MHHALDDLDRQILVELQADARTSFQEIARKLEVSGGTIHVRVNKMKEIGVIKGTRVILDPPSLGYDVCAFIGINLHNARDFRRVLGQLQGMPEVVEAHYTTGGYSLFIKVFARSTKGLQSFLVDKLQEITEIQSTETLISLDVPIERDMPVPLSPTTDPAPSDAPQPQ